MPYFNYYAVKVKKLQETEGKTIKLVDKDFNNIFLEVNGELKVYERTAFRQMIKEKGL